MDVISADAGRMIPDLTAIEFALLIAAHRSPGISTGKACARVGGWFCAPLELAEVTRAVRRLAHRGLIEEQGENLRPTPAALEPATRMLGGMIRLIDNGRGYLDVALLAHLAARKDNGDDHLV